LLPGVEDGDALDVLAALAGRDSADDVGAVAAVVERVERALATGDARDRKPRVLVDEHGHQRCPRRRSAPAGGITPAPRRYGPRRAPRPARRLRSWSRPRTRWGARPLK